MSKNSFIKRTLSLFIAILLICSLTLTAFATNDDDKPTIRVGWCSSTGYQDIDEEGNHSGYYFDYLTILSYYTGWKYEFVDREWNECLELLKNGDIDILCGLTKTYEREQYYDFSNEECSTEMYNIYVRNSNDKYRFADYDSMDGIRIATFDNTIERNKLKDFADAHNINYTEVICDGSESLADILKDNRADAIMCVDTDASDDYKSIAQFNPAPVYFAFTKGNTELVDQANSAMIQIGNYYHDFATTLYNKNISSTYQSGVEYTEEELDFIHSDNTIIMACGNQWYPFEYFDEKKGVYCGISIAIMREIAKQSGLKVKFEFDTGTSMSDFRDNATAFKLTSASYDPNWAVENHVVQTQPFIESSVMRLAKKTSHSYHTVALLDGGYVYREVTKNYPALKVVTCDTAEECVKAVNSGKADCTFLNENESSYYLTNPVYSDIRSVSISKFTQSICFSVSDVTSPLLVSILSKTLLKITDDSMGEFVLDNTPTIEVSPITKMMYTQPIVCVVIVAIFLLLIAITIILIIHSNTEREKRRVMERADNSRSAFFSQLSHDMRTPMNVIINMVKFAKENENSPPTEECLESIDNASEFLLGLINDTLDISKIENGKIELHYAPYRLSKFLLYLNSVALPLCDEKGIEFIVNANGNTDNDGDLIVMMDKLRTNQVYSNIISNAVKYTHPGGQIVVDVKSTPLENGKVHLESSIADNGIGMSEEFQAKMFDAYSQEEREDTNASTGTGLGLSIVKQLMDIMNCTISVESELNKGTKFTLVGDFEVVDEKEIDKDEKIDIETELILDSAEEEVLKGKKIIVCEDHFMNQQIVKRILVDKGMEPVMCRNGQEGVDAFGSSQIGEISAILMDLRMPIMNGFEATEKIRSLDRTDSKTVPIIALSANAYDEDIEKSLEMGMNYHLAKPVHAKEIYNVLYEFIH